MKRKRLVWIAAALAVLAILAAALHSRRSGAAGAATAYSYSFGTMGTQAGCVFYTADPALAESGYAAVRREFDRVSTACNLHDPESELSKLNREADKGFFVCSELLWQVLVEARAAHRYSDGAFDITVKPLMDLRGFYRKRDKLPSSREIAETLKLVGLDKLEWDDARRAVRFKKSGMALDLGGIAKGYALDLAAKAVLDLGIRRGVVDLGGNLFLLPEPPPGKTHYKIGIRSPSGQGDSGEFLELPGSCAISTSGSYERFVVLDGKRCGHVVDPATGDAPYQNYSVTAVAPTGIKSDWLSSSVFLRGRALADKLERELPGVKFHFTCAPNTGK